MEKYKCACCKNIYERGWSDEEALEEKNLLFKNVPVEDCEVVCDDCFKKLITERN